MSKRKNIRTIARSLRNLILALILFPLINSCTKELPEYEAMSPPVTIGEYHIQENGEQGDLFYDMGVHWLMDQGQGHLVFCNFNDRQINVTAILNTDMTFSIPMQIFTSNFAEFQIYQGIGTLSDKKIELTFWGEQDGISFRSTLQGILNE